MPVDGVIPDRIAANRIITNVHKLMVVGKLIGADDGKEFIRRGERIIHQYLRVLPHSLSAMRESADISITVYRMRQGLMAAGVDAATFIATTLQSYPEHDAHLRELTVWNTEELVALPLSAEERRIKRNCTFCGARSAQDRVLLTCGRCRVALYCDEICQRMDWRRGHRTSCVVSESENGTANGVSA
ncbi:unnamed protein product [Zymoseptoria tritici ST99CH_1E4]|uniref:MYND-type domain-containing protein n=1 Tax=Zymoseptoria tritici ST99CH_1E4 TaxID=1276532 RepID=A0A2H1GT27_ZYMTR|nr:unnamed protein product [Zymoseptoria tritici ST99CH_1E4]